jgi:hypothetical protein
MLALLPMSIHIPHLSGSEVMPLKVKTLRAIINGINYKNSIFSIVEENKGDLDHLEDEYSKYYLEPDADQFLINSGATIIRSEIEITDSQGRLRKLVRVQDN